MRQTDKWRNLAANEQSIEFDGLFFFTHFLVIIRSRAIPSKRNCSSLKDCLPHRAHRRRTSFQTVRQAQKGAATTCICAKLSHSELFPGSAVSNINDIGPSNPASASIPSECRNSFSSGWPLSS